MVAVSVPVPGVRTTLPVNPEPKRFTVIESLPPRPYISISESEALGTVPIGTEFSVTSTELPFCESTNVSF